MKGGLERKGLMLWEAVGLVVDLLFPGRCPFCDGLIAIGRRQLGICPECEKKIHPLTGPRCFKCGKKLNDDVEYCADCRRIAHRFDKGKSLYEYGSVAPAIYRMKYAGRREYASYFGRQMAREFSGFLRQIHPDALIPVPLHPARLRARGYNQAALLARALGRESGVPVRENLVYRVRNTKPLKQQNPFERQNNMKKAFIIKQNDVKLKIRSTVIIDDIYTTGSTVDEMARVLKEAGVEQVYVMTLSCGAGI